MKIDTYLRYKTFRYGIFTALILATGFWVLNYEQIASNSNRVVPNSVWVLDFVSVSKSEREFALAHGLNNTVALKLADHADISVAIVMDWNPTTHEEIPSDRINVVFVVEGSTQLVDGQIHVGVRLFDIRRNEYLWRNEYKESLAEYLEDESPLVSQIVRDIYASVSK